MTQVTAAEPWALPGRFRSILAVAFSAFHGTDMPFQMKATTYTTICLFVCTLVTSTALAQTALTATNAPPKSPPWDLSASAGLTLTRGNSHTLLAVANFLGTKKWDQNEVDLGVDGAYGNTTDQKTGVTTKNADSLHGFVQYNRLFTERLFGYLRLEGLHDGVADIDYRLQVSPGAGYYLIKTTNTTFRVEIGPGYIYEKDATETHSYMSLRLAERYDQKLNAHAKLWEFAEVLPQVDKFSNYIINAEAGIETAITKKLSQKTYVQDSYHSEPAPGRLKNDLRLVAALAYKF
jgi:putative salt-induced outer membrane protein YdiY